MVGLPCFCASAWFTTSPSNDFTTVLALFIHEMYTHGIKSILPSLPPSFQQVLQDTHSRAIKYHKANPDNLYVAESFVGKGTYLKRPRYHGRGRHTIMSKYYAHYFLKLREGPPPLKGKPFDKEKSSKRYATWRLIRRGPLSVPNCL